MEQTDQDWLRQQFDLAVETGLITKESLEEFLFERDFIASILRQKPDNGFIGII